MHALVICCLAALQIAYAVSTDLTKLSELLLARPAPESSNVAVANENALRNKRQTQVHSKTIKEALGMSSLIRVKRQWGGYPPRYNHQARRCRRSIREKRMGFPMFGGGPMFGAPPFFGGGGCCCCCCCCCYYG